MKRLLLAASAVNYSLQDEDSAEWRSDLGGVLFGIVLSKGSSSFKLWCKDPFWHCSENISKHVLHSCSVFKSHALFLVPLAHSPDPTRQQVHSVFNVTVSCGSITVFLRRISLQWEEKMGLRWTPLERSEISCTIRGRSASGCLKEGCVCVCGFVCIGVNALSLQSHAVSLFC